MTYTREQLELMSGDELNQSLKVKFLNKKFTFCNSVVVDEFDFNNWNDIMPLAVEYMVDVLPSGSLCTATSSAHSFLSHHKTDVNYTCDSPQRAIACCLLMMELT